ncbi:MAG: sugar ABC transporter permease [Spirochaetales bacterium]|nr:sugar ABC transporter permease [Spirochaetales bacterium]MBR1583401.1 sugar ABC transporter permease [Spirochaetales bacterium]
MKSAAKEIRPSIHRLRIFGRVYEREQVIAAAVLMTPVLVAVFMLFILPVVQVVYYSFTNMTTSKRGTFVGIENFKYLIGDTKFFRAIGNTVLFAVMKLIFDTGLALIIALMLDSHIPLRKFLRSTYFAPVVVPVVASSLIWIWFFDPDVGPLNMILEKLGLEPLLWLNDKSTALVSILMFSVWKGIGYNVMLFLTGLQNIPDSYIEASKVDGASWWQSLIKIKLPLLRPITNFIVMIGIINTFKVFAEIDVMTPTGGPGYSTAMIVTYIYEQAFTRGKMGRACAASIILFVIIFILTQIQSKMNASKTVDYD